MIDFVRPFRLEKDPKFNLDDFNLDESDMDPLTAFEKHLQNPLESSVLNCLDTKQ